MAPPTERGRADAVPAGSVPTASGAGEPSALGADALETAWARVVSRWDDEESHRRFRGLSAALGQLPEAGRRYRAIREGDPDPGKRADAERQINALLAAALHSLEATRRPPPDTARARRTLFLVATGLTLVLVVGVLLLWLR